jgi:hypothetical protein
MTKRCSKCHQWKDREENFYKAMGYKDGYQSYCKQCRKEFPSRTGQARLEQLNANRNRNRQFLWDFYAANPCVDCGEDDPVILELDHCKGLKVKGVSELVHNTHSIAFIQEEIDKCEVVCANCHRRRTATTQGWYVGLIR